MAGREDRTDDDRLTAALPAAGGDDPPLVIAVDYRLGRLQLTGQLDRRNTQLLHDTISALLVHDCDRWTADISGLAVTDHAGLKAIGTAYRRLLRSGRRITLQGASPALTQALTRLRLDHHLLHDTGHPTAPPSMRVNAPSA